MAWPIRPRNDLLPCLGLLLGTQYLLTAITNHVWKYALPLYFGRRIGSKKNILIVGDSINHELQWVFLNHLLDPQQSSRPVRSLSSVRLWQGEKVCAKSCSESGSGFRVGWIRNDRLSRIEHAKADSIGNFYEWPWLKYLEQWDIQILLLNRGAHYEADGVFVRTLRDTFALLQAQYPQVLVFYRNTPPGSLFIKKTNRHALTFDAVL